MPEPLGRSRHTGAAGSEPQGRSRRAGAATRVDSSPCHLQPHFPRRMLRRSGALVQAPTKGQTHREVGTQSHGALGASRTAESAAASVPHLQRFPGWLLEFEQRGTVRMGDRAPAATFAAGAAAWPFLGRPVHSLRAVRTRAGNFPQGRPRG